MKNRLDEIEARLKNSTPPVRYEFDNSDTSAAEWWDVYSKDGGRIAEVYDEDDAIFIANAPADVAALLEVVKISAEYDAMILSDKIDVDRGNALVKKLRELLAALTTPTGSEARDER